MREEQRQEELQASQCNIQDNTPGQEGLSITGQGESSSRRTGRTSYEGQPGRTSSATAATRSGSTSDNHPSERAFSPGPASTPASAAGSSTHTDSFRNTDSIRDSNSTRDSRNGYSPTRSYSHDGWSWDLVELNSADSAALDALPGIGPYYARQILAYRKRLGFYADISQL
ncbi:MAG TPA: helix-hairpin-helix domain-containing protein, partial [Candidatus Coprenecus merdipullorum]|nr:helix-hairpin-helix domain-containing protein [Candidatus Coprenecus merdipullorum]